MHGSDGSCPYWCLGWRSTPIVAYCLEILYHLQLLQPCGPIPDTNGPLIHVVSRFSAAGLVVTLH